MPSLYHFNSDQFKESLPLGVNQQHMVSGRLCQYLKCWQLDALRFLYKHFEKGEACILNDESGLGKVVTVSVLLGALLTNDTTKKCLIIVRDEEYIEGWRFHLSVLTSLTVKVIERTSDINYETVFLIKWSTLKNIGEITKVNFDHVIVDNRGEMLTNKFCTGILLRYFENKISLVISSVDVTANIKLLHILLRLCGRVDKQYSDIKTFEDKFQFPKLKDGVCNKDDLEEYFLKREKLIDFCREFRLRRYCHQFDEEFPLVPCSEFKRHLQQWRTSYENSQSSGSVKLLSSSSEKDTEELFNEYFQVKEERDAQRLDREVQQIIEHMEVDDVDASDEVVVMSPLLFVSDSESEENNQDQVQNTMTEEVKEEDDAGKGQSEIPETLREEVKSVVRNRRKAAKPLNIRELPQKKSLRSQDERKVEVDTTPKRGRKPKVRVLLNEEAIRRLKDVVNITNVQKQAETNKLDNNKAHDETNRLVKRDEDKRRSKVDSKSPVQDKRNSKEDDGKVKKILKPDEVKKKATTRENIKLTKPKEDKTRTNEKEKDSKKRGSLIPDKKNTSDNSLKDRLVKTQTKSNEEEKKTKSEKNKNNTHKTSSDKIKQSKKEEKQIIRAQTQRIPKSPCLNLILNEAQKFLNNKNISSSRTTKKDVEANSLRRRIRKPDALNGSTSANNFKKTKTTDESNSSSSKSTVTSPKIANPSEKKSTTTPHKSPSVIDAVHSPKTSGAQKVQADTPKRSSKPFTVLAPLGVHSKSTRRMQRSTRSSAIQNKYMKIAVAQVGLDKISKAKRLEKQRSSSYKKVKPTVVKQSQQKKPQESQVAAPVVESMQLGQALTPTNTTLPPDFIAPTPKNKDYNFPLMLDKDLPDSECIITSQNNEIIVLTGSTDNEMEPPKTTVSRRKAVVKYPMVTIPRPSFNKAKSPDLFSTCSDVSLPCSQNHINKPLFEGFKIFGSELRQTSKSRSCLDILERMLEPRDSIAGPAGKSITLDKPTCSSPRQHCIDDEDAMFEITSNGTFGNIVRINSNGEMSPLRNKGQSTPPNAASTVGHPKNRITNYLISNNQSGAVPLTSSLEDSTDVLPKTPKRRKSLSGIMKRSPRALSGGITGGKSQKTKLTQWLVTNSSKTSPKPTVAKRRRLELSFPDN